MAANNPHLQKKRSSKRGLGRSLMRRITEIPDSMSRQYSKEEKDGSVCGSASRSGSYKRRRLDSGGSSVKLKDDSASKPKGAPSLKKSHSTYDHTRNTKESSLPTRHESYKEAPLLDSMMRKKLAKKASERSNSDSLDDSAPLVYKSASAHNLMAERKPLHPKPSPLQKSLSVVTSAKEKALLLTNRGYLEDSGQLAQGKEKKVAIEDATTESEVSGHSEVTDTLSKAAMKDLQTDDTSEQTVSSLLEDGSSSEATVCPWETVTAPSTPSENKSQKHVTYASIKSVSINTSELPGRRHHASKKIPPEPPVRQQSLVHSFERKDVTPWEAQEQTQTSGQSLKKDAKDMEDSPEKTEMQRNRQIDDNIPPSVPAGLTRLASIAAEVCPWEVMEMPIPKKKDPEASESDSQKSSPEKQFPSPQILVPKSTMKSLGLAIKAFNRSRIKANIRARQDDEGSPKKNVKETSEKNEKQQIAEGTLMSVGGSARQQVISSSPRESRPEIVSKQATICPWDEEESSLKTRPSKVLEVCPWETSEDGLTQDRASSTEASPSTCANKLHRIKSKRESVCPWETIDDDQAKEEKLSNTSPVVLNAKKKAETCPWELAEVTPSTRSDSQEKASGLDDSKDTRKSLVRTESRKSSDLSKPEAGKSRSADSYEFRSTTFEEINTSIKTEICPWEAEEPLSKQTMSKEDNKGNSKEKSTTPKTEAIKPYQEDTVCPWETMELPERTGARTTLSQKVSDNRINIKTAICPWETSDTPPEDPGDKSKEDSNRFEGRKLRSPLPEETKGKESTSRVSVCPWEDAEDSSTKLAGTTLELGKVVLKKSSSGDSKKVEVCPWEAKAAEVCPWEAASSTFGEGMEEVEGKPSKGITPTTVSSLKAMKDSIEHDSVCPWEDPKAEAALLKPSTKPLEPSKASTDSFQSKKGEIAPWEMQEAKKDIKTAICPWESDDTPVLKKEFKKDASPLPKDEKKGSRDTAPEKGGNDKKESVCPWEWTEDKAMLAKPQSSSVSKAGSKKSDSVENFKAAVCPWETEAIKISPKSDIIPWDKTPALSDKRSSIQDLSGALKRTGDNVSKLPEKAGSPRENICPWETMDVDDSSSEPSSKKPDLSKIKSKKSSSTDSFKADVCPWESQESGPSVKAAVCPWEAPESPVGKRPSWKSTGSFERPTLHKEEGHCKTTEKIMIPLEAICPWETMDNDKPLLEPNVKSPGVPKDICKKSDSTDTLKTEVCPWESQEAEPSIKADVCPWEVPESSVDGKPSLKGDEALERDKSIPPKQTGHSQTTEKVSTSKEAICPWETLDTNDPSSQSSAKSSGLFKDSDQISSSTAMLKEELCPWEGQKSLPSNKADVCPWEVSESSVDKRPSLKRAGAVERSKSASLEKTVHPSEFSAKPKQSKKSDSAESVKAEVCPWEVAEESVLRKDDDSRVHQRGDSRSTSPSSICKATERLSRSREDVCPWESMELEGPSSRSPGQSPALSKAGSKKSNSTDSVRAEICPWEVAEEGVLRKDGDSRARLSGDSRSTSPMSISEAMERLNRSREDICPWESMELEGPSSRSAGQSPALSKAGSKKSGSAESLRAEICPWEFMEEEEVSTKAEMYPWTAAMAPFEKGKLKQDPAETLKRKKGQVPLGTPDSKKTEGESSFKKIEKSKSHQESAFLWKSMEFDKPPAKMTRSLDVLQVSSKTSESIESLKAEICPWEFQEVPTHTKSEISPWEVAQGPSEKGTLKNYQGLASTDKTSTSPIMRTMKTEERSGSQQGSVISCESVELSRSQSPCLPKSGSKKSVSVESLRAEVCPWETEEEESNGMIEMYHKKTAPVSSNEGSLRQNISQGKTQLSPGVIKDGGETVSKKIEKTHSHPGFAYPQEHADELSVKPSSKSLDLPKVVSVKSGSVESLKAEICPWEFQEAADSTKAEVCPWEVAGIPPDREISSRDGAALSKGERKAGPNIPIESIRTLEKGSHTRGSVHSQGSTAAVDASASNISASPSSDKPDRIEDSRKAGICPWETDRPENEERMVLAAKDERATVLASAAAVLAVSVKRSQSKQEGLPGHKPLCRSLPETTLPLDLSKGISPMVEVLAKRRRDSSVAEVCPWEAEAYPTSTREDSAGIPKASSEVCPWETEDISPTSAISAKSKAGEKPKSDKA